MNKDIRNIVLL